MEIKLGEVKVLDNGNGEEIEWEENGFVWRRKSERYGG